MRARMLESPTVPGERGAESMAGPLLSIENLFAAFYTRKETVRALNGVTLDVGHGEVVGLVGETGSGKSVTVTSILRLLRPPGRVVSGRVTFDGRDLTALPEREMVQIRGGQIGLVVQNAKSALNPLMRVGDQILQVYRRHRPLPARELTDLMHTTLRAVAFSDPEDLARKYPHELSGGMAQRVVLAIATGTSPKLLLADEPTTGLDATIQLQVLNLIKRMLDASGASALLVTHDLGIVARYCDRVAVMHAGQIVEVARVEDFFRQPSHPYSAGLLNDLTSPSQKGDRITVRGVPPDLRRLPSGCLYRLRCPLATDLCAEQDPPMVEVELDHWAKCHHIPELLRLNLDSTHH